ncbi:MAG TPA: hypothetical protein VNZ86_19640, partial [Bacteroidia bacterium]|nr:hypothetical protein [Bacteroidia bacterium]
MKKIYFLCFITLSSLSITAQNCFWAHGIGGSVNDQSNAVAFDLSGNVFSTGYFSSPSIIIGSDTLKNNSGGNENFFLVKYDYTGNALWARSAAGSITNMGMAVATDQQGNSYVSGYFRASTITFGTIVLTNPNIGTAVMFIVKYDRNGNVIWATQEGGYTTNDNICNALAIDSHKNLYMTGRFHGTKIFFGVDTLFNKGGADIFIAKFDSLGNPLWARGAGGSQWDIGRSIAVDQTGNSYTTGDYISDTIRFGTTALTVHDFGTDQVFTVKYDPNGNLIWAKTFGGNQANIGMGITTDAGQVYVTGQFNSTDLTFGTTVLHLNGANNIFMVKYDANGNPLWAKGMGGTGTDWGQGIAADHKGRIHFSGSFQSSTVIFGPDTLTSAGGQSAFIAQADTAGHILNAYSPGHGITAAIAADTSGHTCFSGYFQTSQTYNGTTINSVGSYDAFVAETYPFTAPVSSFTNILCFGQTTGSATVTVSGGVSPYTYSWNSGSSASSASGLAAGPHTVQILDALGCKVKTTVMLTQPAAALTVNTTSVTVNCNTNTHG